MQRDECVGVQRGATSSVRCGSLGNCWPSVVPTAFLSQCSRVVGAIVYDPTTEACRAPGKNFRMSISSLDNVNE